MLNKIYSNTKKFIKENIIHIIIVSIFIIGLNIHFPYYIETPGGLVNLSKRMITKSNKIKGSYNITFINSYSADLWRYLIAKINKNWDIVPISDYYDENEDNSDYEKRDKLMLYNAFSNAYYVAHKLANKNINIKNSNVHVLYIDEYADTNLKVGDKINKLDGKKIENINEIIEYVNTKDEDDKIIVETDNGEKYITVDIVNNKKILSIYVITNYEYDTDIKYNYGKKEYGSSGGLMMSLAIYDYITPYDLSKGRKIAGTGTIEIDGTVGEIAGVRHKIITASKNKVDIFFIPEGNYEEAKKVIDERNYKINLVSVKNINDAIDYLNK